MPLITTRKAIKIFVVLLLYLSMVAFLSYADPAFGLTGGGPLPPGTTGTCQDTILISSATKDVTVSEGLEVKYPSIQGVTPIATGKDVLPTFIKWIFYFAIAVSGFVVFGVIVYHGVKALAMAAGNPSALDEARRGIIAGIIGIVLLLGSVLLLNTVNPQIVELKLEKIEVKPIEQTIGATAGVYLLEGPNDTEEIDAGDKILKIRKNVSTTGSIPALAAKDFDNKTKDLCVNPNFREDLLFHAVLHTEENYRGSCRVFYDVRHTGNLDFGGVGADLDDDVSSVRVFTSKAFGAKEGEDFSSDFAVIFYKNAQFFDDPEDPDDVCRISAQEIRNVTDIGSKCPGWTKEDISSLRVGFGWVLAAFEKDDGNGRCEIFGTGQVPELRTHYIGQCIPTVKTPIFEGLWKPCIGSIAVFKGHIK